MTSIDIAIVGMSGRYPDAGNLHCFHDNLRRGLDSVRPLSAQRTQFLKRTAEARISAVAALERIDCFDHEFFGISLREAQYMDPQQRMLLELSCGAIENAGLPLSRLRGSDTGVFIGASNTDFYQLLQLNDPLAITGNLPSALAGRISYQLGLCGPALVIDTACSSSLVAVIQACDQLALGRMQMALVGGINVFFIEDPLAAEIGICSPDGKCRSFDAAANGTGWGEGGGVMLLTTLQHARDLRLPVHALIKGSAVNQDGQRCSGLTAPSPTAQAEVIHTARARAGVAAETIGYVEAHGTATALGDPIEIEGLNQAARKHTAAKQFCALGSVKTNIGHLMGAAGIAGLTKAVLGLKHRELYASLHYTSPNPLVDFENSPCYVNSTFREWPAPANHPRRAGVSAFGLSGTNAHVILEEAPACVTTLPASSPLTLVTLSAKNQATLQRYAQSIADHVERTRLPLHEVAYTLNCGRDNYPYAFATCVGSIDELVSQLRDVQPVRHFGREVIALFSGTSSVDEPLAAQPEGYQQILQQCRTAVDASLKDHREVALFANHWAAYRQWQRLGINPTKLIGTASGVAVTDLLQGRLELKAALIKAVGIGRAQPLDTQKLRRLISNWMTQRPAPLFLEIGIDGALSRELEKLQALHFADLVILRPRAAGKPMMSALCDLYRAGARIDWDAHYSGNDYRRIELPTYPFAPTSCWNAEIIRRDSHSPTAPTLARNDGADVLTDAIATATQTRLAGIWAETLRVERLTLESNYFDLGGHSLTGLQMLNHIEATFSVRLEFEQIYSHPTLRSLAALIDSQRAQPASTEQPVDASGHEAEAPLSFQEQRMWFLDQLDQDSALYNIPLAIRIRNALQIDLIQRALDEIVRRHDVLRTAFATVDGKAVRIVRPQASVPISITNLQSRPEQQRDAELNSLTAAETRRIFNLAEGPLIRVSVIRMHDADHVLLITMHHIICDLWSTALLVRELTLLYQGFLQGKPAELPPLALSYRDFACQQRQALQGERLERQLEYWRNRLQAAPALVTFPSDAARPAVRTYQGRHLHFTVPEALTRKLKETARGFDATLFMVLLAALKALLHRYTGETRIPIGTPIAGRTSRDTEQLIGFFANTLVILSEVEGGISCVELIRRVRQSALEAYRHQEMPFEKLLDELHAQRTLSHAPLFQIMLVLQNIAIDIPDQSQLSIEISEPDSGRVPFDMTISMREAGNHLAGRVEYNSDLYSAATVERIVEQFRGMLASFAADPHQQIEAVVLLDTSQREHVLRAWNDTAQVYDQGEYCLHELIDAQVRKTPHHPAVVFEQHSLTYAQLQHHADALALQLIHQGVGPETIVAVCAQRCVELVVALVAILKSGAAYLPLDPQLPTQRLHSMLEHSRARVVLTQDAFRERFDTGVMVLGVELQSSAQCLPTVAVQPAHPAYVIYTSGTTGQPKGVVIPHRGIVNRLLWMQEQYALDGHDRVLQKTPYTFDVSVWEFFWPLITGATVVLARPEGHRDPAYLADLIHAQRITTLHFVPSMLSAFVQAVPQFNAPDLRQVFCSGEALMPDQVEHWLRLSSAQLHNLYGPTEASVDVSFWHCRAEQALRSIPIGRPIANTQLYILDARGEPVPVGVCGELSLGGVGLARGYLNQPALTAERFVPDPFSSTPGARLYRTGDRARYLPEGAVEFLGRLDHQLKLRGFRIEPAEIEHALTSHPQVHQAVVVPYQRESHTSLVAYLVAEAVDAHTVREYLKQRLPEYMVPAQFVMLSTLPLTANGKLDRAALPTPERPTLERDYLAPSTEIERTLCEIWRQLLGIPRIGVRDNFFELGGDSILGVQMVARATAAGIRLTARQLFEHQHIQALATVAGRSQSLHAEQSLILGEVQLTPIQHWFFQLQQPRPQHWNQAVMLSAHQPLQLPVLQQIFNTLLQRHDALRHRFEPEPWRQVARSPEQAPLQLESEDLSALAPTEREAAIARAVNSAQRALDLQHGPMLAVRCLHWQDQTRLLIVVHHLLIDGVSWRILLDELQRGYLQLMAGQAASFAPKTTSFQYWAQRLVQHTQQLKFHDQLPYWLQHGRGELIRLPHPQAPNLEASVRTAHIGLDAPLTRQLLQEVHQAYNTTVQEVLLAALASAVLHWSEHPRGRLLIHMEGHGREEALFEDIDLSRTLGWFTTLYPLCLTLDLREAPGQTLKTVKETLRQVPDHGIGYGALRYLAEPDITAQLAAIPTAQLSFNYLGRFDEVLDAQGPFALAPESLGDTRDPNRERPHLLDFSADISRGRLALRCSYSAQLHATDHIEQLMQLIHTQLTQLLLHCLQPDAGDYTPSDFPDELLSEQDLEEIFSQLANPMSDRSA